MNRFLVRATVPMLGVLAVGLAGCAAPTPYQPALDGHGYAEQALEDDRYRVTFSGNTLTPRETVENYLLYRAAEVTVANGGDYFLVVDKDIERNTTYHSFGGFGHHGFHRFHGFHHGHGHGFGGFGGGHIRSRDSYDAFANIVVREGHKPSDDPNAYDARDVLERLAPTIARRPAS